MPRQFRTSDRLLTHVREYREEMLPDTAQIYRAGVATPNEDFGTTQTYELLDTVPANYWSMTGQEALVLERIDVRASDMVALPALTDITEHDQIVYTVAETGAIHHFDVSFVHDGSRRAALHVAVIEYKFDQEQHAST